MNNQKHIIYNLDNENLKHLPENSIDMVVTSPPYVTTEFKKGQKFDYEGFLDHFKSVCKELYRVLIPGGRFALNVADIITKYRYPDEGTISRIPFGSDTFQIAQSEGFRLLERFIWDKGFTRNFGGPLLGSYPYPPTIFNNNYFEYIYILRKPGKRKTTNVIRKESRLSLEEWRLWSQQWWRVESISEKFDYHRAIYPVEIPYRLIRMYSYVGDTILDPYMGSGSSMIAAHRCDRNSIGFESDETLSEMVRHRLLFESEEQLEYSIKGKDND